MGFEYRVNGGTVVDLGSALSVLLSSLMPDTTYTFEVRSYDSAGNRSSWTSITTTTASDITAPSVPAGLTATAQSTTTILLEWDAATDEDEPPTTPDNVALDETFPGSITATWDASTDSVPSGVAGYEVSVDAGAAIDVGNVLTYLVEGLTAATEYDFQVRSYDEAGNRSAYCTVVPETTNAAATFHNVALSANGSSATATATGGGNATNLINGVRTAGGSWPSGAWDAGTQPATVEITFPSSKNIERVDVITIRDTYNDPADPDLVETFASFGIKDYTVDYWNGSSWTNIVTITGNTNVWRQHTFTELATTKIRLVGTQSMDSTAIRLAEIEAWGTN